MIKPQMAVPNTICSLNSQWRTFPLFGKTKKAMEFFIHALLLSIWKERNGRLFEDVYRDFTLFETPFIPSY